MDFVNDLKQIIDHLAQRLPDTVVTLIVGLLVIEFIIFLFGKFLRFVPKLPVALKKLIYALVRAFLWMVLFLVVLQTLGLNNILVAIAGSATVLAIFLSAGVAPLVTDILAGLSLASDNDFTEGTKVRAGDNRTEGTIDRVELRKTRIAGKDGQLHVIPNSLIDKNEWVVLKRVSRRSTRRKR